ncbi:MULTISPECIES: LolA family protein [unclassified Olleya]|jgi:outer membrane lipoprotein-sorting protein|uniref:LolA family protein n=1 Tax=unclassified Olleya TaxID=2615019 RepID=UPI0011A2112D|nr:outer membrane lipoprotein carrier protein LolA [Olleya sp. Hel_I_94]TVZ46749.1 outer membrane lipoprotein-sorting protein [Olleya sp. Hel_I_94]|tara:strand:+ start:190637 stop:191272 length:636 start_codon:yes stop_codon:yes gene_type:complete
MKKLLVLFLLATSSIFAQDDQANKLLNEVSNKAKSYNNISIAFKYVLENTEENIKQETKGDVVMEGDKYRLNILGITRIYDGQNIYSISPEDEEVTVSKGSDQDESTITPSKMLTFYKEGFTFKMDIVQDVNGRKIQYIKLTPMDSNSEIKYVLLGIDTKTKHIYRLIEVGNNGTKTTLTVNSFKTNETLSKSLFTFDKNKFKDYYINKLD